MPNTPAQFPNFDLPGAEWFSLAPNANIAIQGRRRRAFQNLGTVSDSQLATLVSGVTPLETDFTISAGIYVHAAWVIIKPNDVIPNMIITPALFLNLGGSVGQYPLGQTFPTPIGGGNSTLLSERDRLITQRDIAATSTEPSGATLNLVYFIAARREDVSLTGSNGFYLNIALVYSRLDGFTE